MNWRWTVILASLTAISCGAWGQAAAEYGLTVSKSAAAAAATANRLNAHTSAVISAAGNVDRSGPSNKASTSARSAPRRAGTPSRQANSPAAPLPAPTSEAQRNSLSISVQGGASGKGRTQGPKYPTAIQITTSNQPPKDK